MIILISGESHAGKTLMAQKLLEKYKIPYLSLDHIKMGMVRGYPQCGFTPLDDDEVIAEKMWPVVKGIIDTCKENNQHIIMEGCYLPPNKVKEIISDEIIPVYIVFSENYILNSFNKIMEYENIIERRNFRDDRRELEYINDNTRLKNKCIDAGLDYFEIDFDYSKEIDNVYNYIDNKMMPLYKYKDNKIVTLHKYKEEYIDEVIELFFDTVHNINIRDYSKEEVEVWASKDIDKVRWNKSLLENETIVAKISDKIVGFADLDNDYLDRLYVHKDYQNQGIANSILKYLEQFSKEEGIEKITTHASITSLPFFKSKGYKIVKEQKVERNGVYLKNYIMEKIL